MSVRPRCVYSDSSRAGGAAPAYCTSGGQRGGVLAWPDSFTGFVLQGNTGPTTTNWVGVTNLPVVVNGENRVTVSPAIGSCYYRLKYQP
jgi:hypothetical protein